MAQVYNPTTGEWEEKPDEGTNAFSTGGATSTGPGLSNLYDSQQSTTTPQTQYTGGPGGSGIMDPNIVNPAYWGNSSAKIYEHTPGGGGGDSMYIPGTNWIERDGYRFDQQLGQLEQNNNGTWGAVTTPTPFFDPNAGLSENGRLQLGTGMANAPSNIGMNDLQKWSVSSGLFNEPSRSDGMTAGEALLMTGGAAFGAGAFGGFGGAGGLEALSAADMSAGLLPEFGTSLGYSAGLGVGDGIGTLLGDPSYWASSLGDSYGLEGLSGMSELPAAAELPSSVTNMEQGFRELSQLNNPSGWNSSPLNPDVTALENTGSNAFVDHGIQSPITKPYTPDYGTMADAEAAVNYGATGESFPLGMDTLGSTNKFSSLFNTVRGGGMGMNDLAGLFKKPTPLELGVRGLGSLDSWLQGKKAQDVMEEQMNRMRGAEDSNAARGSAANDMWLRTQQDPMYGYDSFMQGAGRDFTNNARAASAKSGSRGSYLNSGRMNSDLASLWQKNQTQRASSIAGGFSNSPYSSSSSMTPGYANLIKNQNAPLFQGLSGAMQSFKLADLFGGD